MVSLMKYDDTAMTLIMILTYTVPSDDLLGLENQGEHRRWPGMVH